MAIFVTSLSPLGHHDDYLRLFHKLADRMNVPVTIKSRGFTSIFVREPIFFTMLEYAPVDFALTSLCRALMGRSTSALLFRAAELTAPRSLRLRLKRVLLKIVRRFPKCRVMTILPFTVDPRFAEIAQAGIYDPQLWDMEVLGGSGRNVAPSSELVAQIDAVAAGRKVVVAMGLQNHEKGFDFLAKIWSGADGEALRRKYLFVVAGIVAASSAEMAREFCLQGGLLIDRRLATEEMQALYRRAALIWSCYAPYYNQASGIYGRAIQSGVPVIVRHGSYLATLSEHIGYPAVELRWDEDRGVCERLDQADGRVDRAVTAPIVQNMYRESVAAIEKAIGTHSVTS